MGFIGLFWLNISGMIITIKLPIIIQEEKVLASK